MLFLFTNADCWPVGDLIEVIDSELSLSKPLVTFTDNPTNSISLIYFGISGYTIPRSLGIR